MTNGTHGGIQLRGSIPAIVTPMHEDGSLDLPAFRKLIDWHVAEGSNGLVVVGTSGESATLSVEEHVLMIQTAVEHTAGRFPIIAGAGGNSTSEAIELSKAAKKVGADATLQVVPYYNKPTQEGMYRHFAKIAESVDLPVVLYNVPGRTVADMSNETILRLAQRAGHHRREGSDGQHRSRRASDQVCARGFRHFQRRRSHRDRADAARRPRQYFGDGERRAEAR